MTKLCTICFSGGWCLYNARRSSHILDPVAVQRPDGKWFWDPATGGITRNPTHRIVQPPRLGDKKAQAPSSPRRSQRAK